MATKKFCPNHPTKQIFCKGLCKPCYVIDYNKRKIVKLNLSPKENRKPISMVSEQRKKLNSIYSIIAQELKPLHTKCEAQLPGCTHKATQIHHKKGRRGIMLILSKYFGYQCDNCHKICTKDSKLAKELGLSLPINSTTEYDFTPRELELIEKYNVNISKVTISSKGHITLY